MYLKPLQAMPHTLPPTAAGAAPYTCRAIPSALTELGVEQTSLLNRQVLGLALLTAAAVFSAPGAQAGTCTETMPNIYVCSGPAIDFSDMPFVPSNEPISISTSPGFGIDTSSTATTGYAIGTGGLGAFLPTNFTFSDSSLDMSGELIPNRSAIRGGNDGLFISPFSADGTTISVTTTGVVEGVGNRGVASYQGGGDTITRFDLNESSGGRYGVQMYQVNRGPISLTTRGLSEGVSLDGIDITMGFGATIAAGVDDPDSTITVNALNEVTGGRHGIRLRSIAGGAQSITTSGNITAGDTAIYARHYDTFGGNAYTGTDEIYIIVNDGATDPAAPTTTLTGGTGPTIDTRSSGLAEITVNPGVHITSASNAGTGTAISNDDGDSNTTIYGAQVSGAITLAAGGDDLIFDNGADFSTVTSFDGGDDPDTLRFAGTASPTSGMLTGSTVIGWERIVIDSGATISFSGTDTLSTNDLVLNSGGTLNLLDSTVGDALTDTGNFAGGGTLSLDAVLDDGSTPGNADQFTVTGDTSGTTTVRVNNVNGPGGETTSPGILLITVNGNSDGSFVLPPGEELRAGDYVYDLVEDGGNWYLQSRFSPASNEAEEIPIFGVWGAALLSGLMAAMTVLFRRKTRF